MIAPIFSAAVPSSTSPLSSEGEGATKESPMHSDSVPTTSVSVNPYEAMFPGIDLAPPTVEEVEGFGFETADEFLGLRLYSMIGREGGAAAGDLDPTPIMNLISDPSKFGIEPGKFKIMKHGCPYAKGNPHKKGGHVMVAAKKGQSLTMLCWDDEHKHPPESVKQGKDHRLYAVFTVRTGVKTAKFPPFETGSHTELARVLARTTFAGCSWEVGGVLRQPTDNGKWKIVPEASIKQAIRELDGEWIDLGKNKDGERKVERVKISNGACEGVYSLLMSEFEHKRLRQPNSASGTRTLSPFMGSPKPCVSLQDGILDLSSGGFVKGSDPMALTYCQPDEQTLPCRHWGAKAPPYNRWGNLLWKAWGHRPDFDQRVLFLQEWVGAALAGEVVRSQKHLLLKGLAHSGKSQVIDVIRGLFPESAVISVSPTELSRFNQADFATAKLNAMADPGRGRVDAGRMKALQSGDLVTVERKHQQPFPMQATAAWIIGCNTDFTPDEQDDSVYRRWVVLDFDRKVKEHEKIVDLAKIILREERAGILAWAVEGYARYRDQGEKFTDVFSSKKAVEDWRLGTDPGRRWVSEALVAAPGSRLRTQAAMAAYTAWARDEGLQHLLTAKTLSEKVLAYYPDAKVIKSNGIMHFDGVKLAPAPVEAELSFEDVV